MSQATTEARPILSAEALVVGYGATAVLRDVSLTINAGEFVGVVGRNGAGKSTLLKTLLGLIPPLSGEVRRSGCGEPTSGDRFHYGYVPQRDTIDPLFPLSVRQIVAMGRYGRVGLARRLGRDDWEVVDRAIEQVNGAAFARRQYSEISGGQRQRALIARALAVEPDLLVLDEPTVGMDLASEHALLELIERLHHTQRLTILMVTHELIHLANYAHRIAIVAGGSVEFGTLAEMLDNARLSRLYEVPVQVDRLKDRVIITPAELGSDTGGLR
jgi:ABC-type Mn2+/Zn2+ transport system ATPase subunit